MSSPSAPTAGSYTISVVAFALRRENIRTRLSARTCRWNDFLFQLLHDRTKLLFHQPEVVFLRRSLQLPLVLEQRSLVDVPKQFAQVEILPHAARPRTAGLRIFGGGSFTTGLLSGEHRPGFVIDRGGLAYSLTVRGLPAARLASCRSSCQVFHDVQAGKRVVGVEHGRSSIRGADRLPRTCASAPRRHR